MNDYLNGTPRGGTLAGATEVVSLVGRTVATLTLRSGDASRAIEVSTDNGTEYFTLPYDANTATMLVLAIDMPASHVKFTGAAGDTWRVQ